jgi:hypothetical protein
MDDFAAYIVMIVLAVFMLSGLWFILLRPLFG